MTDRPEMQELKRKLIAIADAGERQGNGGQFVARFPPIVGGILEKATISFMSFVSLDVNGDPEKTIAAAKSFVGKYGNAGKVRQCQMCKHWGQVSFEEALVSNLSGVLPKTQDWGECTVEKTMNGQITPETFGCIDWERK